MAANGSRKLNVTLPSDTEILLTREFDAPAPLVYKAMTTPEYVRRWWNCMDHKMPVCEIDLRVGGAWRFVTVDDSGTEYGFHGVYKEIVEPTRLVHTEIFEMFPTTEVLVTITLEPKGGKTLVKSHTQCPNKETRDGIIQSGMETGAAIAWDRVEEIARGLAPSTSSAAQQAPS